MSNTEATIDWVDVNLDVTYLPVTKRYNGFGWEFHPDQARVQPSRAKVTLFPGTDEAPSVHVYGYIVKADGTADNRYNTQVLIIGALGLEEVLANKAESLLKGALK